MLRTTQWKPDTCECFLEYEWDDSVPVESRQHIIKNIYSKCKAHENLGAGTIFETVLGENQLKNRVMKEIADAVAGGDMKFIKDVKFSFTADRKLSYEIPGATAQELSAIDSKLDSKDKERIHELKSVKEGDAKGTDIKNA